MAKPTVPPSKFDPTAAEELQVTASTKLLQMLKAKRGAKRSSSTREFAVRCVRGLEATIHQLFEEGTNTQEVLSQLIEALPSIPVDDLRYALRAIGSRKRLHVSSQPSTAADDTAASAKNNAPQTGTETRKEKEFKPQSGSAAPTKTNTACTNLDLPAWADGSDKRADESDEDYRLRKEIEGPPEARHKFIGEHKT
ncbi:hypothetical protein [Ferrovum myxofaciens]|uniref:hypothetical protein n=1 Tax=Ferrovum myxofaciens TaxID=416213 RepID=UPI0004E2358A|nr:hypothetical protein [Ferrovum myxofaciens]